MTFFTAADSYIFGYLAEPRVGEKRIGNRGEPKSKKRKARFEGFTVPNDSEGHSDLEEKYIRTQRNLDRSVAFDETARPAGT